MVVGGADGLQKGWWLASMERKTFRQSQPFRPGLHAASAAPSASRKATGISGKRLSSPTVAETEAAAWIARLDSDHVSESDREAFRAWYEANEEHRQAADAMSDLFAQLDLLRRRP
ncbi:MULTISPECIES: FecR/PupR family sigma factor regulator [Sphingobium]|uniref:FecR/PupR family sigma factor regulator n=1 Tax=Sphingobium TaxID=165695 RepID=UPI0011A61170|nr:MULTISPECIES: FecR/PupR family sigma factor regulator [Sphingobium]